jgi:type VI secretion system protein ImpA
MMDYEETIISPISDEFYCGENLDEDSGFQNFFFEAQGIPERYDGQTTNPAEPPDWREVKKKAIVYLGKTKDLKLLSILSQAVLNTEGIVKFESCLSGISKLIEQQWQTIYPPLDEDDGDPIERVSALGYLSDTFIINALKTLPLAESKVLGKVSVQTIDKAIAGAENVNDGDNSKLSISQIKGIFSEVDVQNTINIFTAVNNCIAHLNDINESFVKNAGSQYSVTFDGPLAVLKQISSALEKYANVQIVVEEAPDSDESTDGGSSTNQHSSQTRNGFDATGKMRCREDVEKCFNLILEYYSEFEPSSPIPILVKRANKLVHLDFLEIMKDIYPDALQTLHKLGGIEESDNN